MQEILSSLVGEPVRLTMNNNTIFVGTVLDVSDTDVRMLVAGNIMVFSLLLISSFTQPRLAL